MSELINIAVDAMGGEKKKKKIIDGIVHNHKYNKENFFKIFGDNDQISKLNLKMIENIDKPALSALWPNRKGMSVVLDLGANIECSSKNLIDFSIMGSSLYKSLYQNEDENVAL